MKDYPCLYGYEKERNKGVRLNRTILVAFAARMVLSGSKPCPKRYKTKHWFLLQAEVLNE